MTEAEKFYEVAKRLLLNKKYFDAAQFLTKAINSDPNFSDAYFLRDTIYLVRWDWDAEKYAVADFTKFTELEPDNAEGWFKRGKAFAWLHRFNPTDETNGLACEYLTRAIELAPDNVKYYCQRAFLKKPDVAITDYTKAIELAPNNKYIYFLRSRIDISEELGNFSAWLKDLSKLIALEPADYSNYIERAKLYFKLKNCAATLEDLNQAVGVAPYEKNTYYERGVFYWNIGEAKKARANFIQANVAIKGMERAIKRARRIPKKLLGKMAAPINKNSVLRPEDLKGIL